MEAPVPFAAFVPFAGLPLVTRDGKTFTGPLQLETTQITVATDERVHPKSALELRRGTRGSHPRGVRCRG